VTPSDGTRAPHQQLSRTPAVLTAAVLSGGALRVRPLFESTIIRLPPRESAAARSSSTTSANMLSMSRDRRVRHSLDTGLVKKIVPTLEISEMPGSRRASRAAPSSRAGQLDAGHGARRQPDALYGKLAAFSRRTSRSTSTSRPARVRSAQERLPDVGLLDTMESGGRADNNRTTTLRSTAARLGLYIGGASTSFSTTSWRRPDDCD